MDPNACLERMLTLANEVLDDPTEDGDATAADELADMVLSMNEWLEVGGFLPKRWEKRK